MFTKEQENDIVYMCLRKCINDLDKNNLSDLEQLCFSWCTFKFIDSFDFTNSFLDFQ